MTKKQTKPVAPTRKKPAEPVTAGARSPAAGGHQVEKTVAVKRATKATIRRALDELGINRPYYTARVVGGRLELALYGGDVVYWPEAPSEAKGSEAPSEAKEA